MKDLKMMFEGSEIKIIVNEKGEPLFELYSTAYALGYGRIKTVKGKEYKEIQKSRIHNVLNNAEISTFPRGVEKYIDINGLRKFISLSNTSNKLKFIELLQDKGYLKKEEVFAYSRKEIVLMDHLNKILQPMGYTLETQKIDGNYRLDGYIPELDLVIEYDENGHTYYDLNKENTRELYIKSKYSHLLRLTDSDDLMTNIGKIINKIIEIVLIDVQVDTLRN